MPRQRMRPRRGSPWHPRRPCTSSSPSGSSTQALECLAAIDVFDTWWSSSAQPSPPPLASDHGRRSKTPCPNLPRESYVILHDLVFELRDGVNDLQFRVQQMEGRLTVLLQLLANLPAASPEDSNDASLSDHAGSHDQDDTEGSLQSAGKADTPVPLVDSTSMPALVSNERGDEGPIVIATENETSSRLQPPTSVASVKLEDNEDKADDITDMQWTLSGRTPIIEEPWPGLLPEYKPDYTQLVPYSSSHGSPDS